MYTIFTLDIRRSLDQGLIKDDAAAFLKTPSLYQYSWSLFNNSHAFQYAAEESVDTKIRESLFLNLYDFEKWTTTEYDLHTYNKDPATGKVTWETRKIARQIGPKIFQDYFLHYNNRNFSTKSLFL